MFSNCINGPPSFISVVIGLLKNSRITTIMVLRKEFANVSE